MVEVKNSWQVSENRIVAELKSKKPLMLGLALSSTDNKVWVVQGRVIFNHTTHLQVVEENENIIPIQFKFSSQEDKEKSINNIVASEKQGFRYYLLEPNEHNEKPIEGIELKIID